AVVAEVCTGHAEQDAYAPQEAVREGQQVGTEGIGMDIYRYPNGCNANNCFVATVFSNTMQIAFTASMSTSTIDVNYNMVAHPTKVIVQRYK
ncbi:MAG: hypothetical protein RSD23_05850, partial [Ruthenibacterium sp.]